MPRAALGSDISVIEEDYTATATVAKITRRDGVVIRLTDHMFDLVYEGETFIASSGYSRTSIENREGTKVDETDITALFSNTLIDEDDLAKGLYNYADVILHDVYWKDPTKFSQVRERGRFGRVVRTGSGAFKVEIRSITEKLQGQLGRLIFPRCGWDLGEPNTCRVPILPDDVQRSTSYALGDFIKVATGVGSYFSVYENRIYECVSAGTTAVGAPVFDTVVGNTTVDGTVTWKAYEAWTRHGTVNTVIDPDTFTVSLVEARAVDDWFTAGTIYFLQGNNSGLPFEVKEWISLSGQITLARSMGRDLSVGDAFRISPGCNKARTLHCRNKFVMAGSFRFANGAAKYHGGFDGIPGRQYMLQNPGITAT